MKIKEKLNNYIKIKHLNLNLHLIQKVKKIDKENHLLLKVCCRHLMN